MKSLLLRIDPRILYLLLLLGALAAGAAAQMGGRLYGSVIVPLEEIAE